MTTVLTRDEIDAAFNQPNENGFGKSRYDIARLIEAAVLEKQARIEQEALIAELVDALKLMREANITGEGWNNAEWHCDQALEKVNVK